MLGALFFGSPGGGTTFGCVHDLRAAARPSGAAERKSTEPTQRWASAVDTSGRCLAPTLERSPSRLEPPRPLRPPRPCAASSCRCAGSSPADADDLAQRTLVVALDAMPRLRPVSLGGFVHAIAHKLLLRHRRDQARARARHDHQAEPEALLAAAPSPCTTIDREGAHHRLRHALGGLPEGSARLLRLRYWEERDTQQIATQLGLRPGAVRTRLHRARHELSRALAAEGTPCSEPSRGRLSGAAKEPVTRGRVGE